MYSESMMAECLRHARREAVFKYGEKVVNGFGAAGFGLQDIEIYKGDLRLAFAERKKREEWLAAEIRRQADEKKRKENQAEARQREGEAYIKSLRLKI